MEIHAWIQMGDERRETVIEIPTEEFKNVKERAEETGNCLEVVLEDYVRDWMYVQYGWGWSGAGFDNDFGCMEGASAGGCGAYVVTSNSSIPNTKKLKLCAFCRRPVHGDQHTSSEQG